jgi:hypothetical protein
MSEQVVPSAVEQRSVVKFLTKGKVKPAEMLMTRRAQVGDETQSRTQASDWSKIFKEGRREVEREGKLKASGFWDSQGVLFIHSSTQQRTINAAYYMKLLKDREKPVFLSKRRGLSVKSFCLLHDNARSHIAAVTTGALVKIHWEVLPHPTCSPDLGPSDFHLFSPIKEALGGKKFRANDEFKLFVQRWLEEEPNALFEKDIMKVPE